MGARTHMTLRHGGQILVDQLKIEGVTRVFSVPGESFLAALDGLYESGIDNVVCRHCLLYTSPSPRDRTRSRMPSSA